MPRGRGVPRVSGRAWRRTLPRCCRGRSSTATTRRPGGARCPADTPAYSKVPEVSSTTSVRRARIVAGGAQAAAVQSLHLHRRFLRARRRRAPSRSRRVSRAWFRRVNRRVPHGTLRRARRGNGLRPVRRCRRGPRPSASGALYWRRAARGPTLRPLPTRRPGAAGGPAEVHTCRRCNGLRSSCWRPAAGWEGSPRRRQASIDLLRRVILPYALLAPAATGIGMKVFDARWDPLHGYLVAPEQHLRRRGDDAISRSSRRSSRLAAIFVRLAPMFGVVARLPRRAERRRVRRAAGAARRRALLLPAMAIVGIVALCHTLFLYWVGARCVLARRRAATCRSSSASRRCCWRPSRSWRAPRRAASD